MATRSRGGDDRRLLAASAVPPWPTKNGYGVRAANLLDQLARTWDITVVSPAPEPEEPERDVPGAIEWIPVEGVPATNSLPWREERKLLADRAAALIHERDFRAALLWSGTEFMATEIAGFPAAVADRIDCQTLQAWRNRRHRGHLRQKIRRLRSGLEMILYERGALRTLRGLVVTGPDDARALRRITGHRRVEIIPNGVELPPLDALPGEGEQPTVIFTGVLSYEPNIEAARYFAREVWPKVRGRVPEARLVIAGRSPVPEVTSLHELPGVIVRANVPDLSVEIRRAWVAVAPMRSGSGIKNKVLEAWAAARPVVLSELATNGLGLEEGPPSLLETVCRDGPTMARTVADLLEDRSAREALGREARALAEERHSWKAAGQTFSRFIADTLDVVPAGEAGSGSVPLAKGGLRTRSRGRT